ncbi:MAG: sulfite exporter TauE/SafE family protein [Chitinophagales bacterium]|nr:sulfite exporter TauE/SafE family protein [Chitinophagales bacterium]
MGFLLAALSLGFLGSFHCVGMCGPIALALPLGRENRWKQIAGALVYNLGRIFTYGIFGLIFGLLGKGFVLGGYQQALSIILGIIILLGLLLPTKVTSVFGLTKVIQPLVQEVKSLLSGLFRQKSFGTLFLIGLLNGLLPCGLVYLGVAGAIATGDVVKGSLFMMMFGAGTIPAMLLVGLAANIISLRWRNNIRKVVPAFIAIMAVVLILRGMNLGIPYVSPELSKTDCTKHSCCHKK